MSVAALARVTILSFQVRHDHDRVCLIEEKEIVGMKHDDMDDWNESTRGHYRPEIDFLQLRFIVQTSLNNEGRHQRRNLFEEKNF